MAQLFAGLRPTPGDVDLVVAFEDEGLTITAAIAGLLVSLHTNEHSPGRIFPQVHVAVHEDLAGVDIPAAIIEQILKEIGDVDANVISRTVEKVVLLKHFDAGTPDALLAWWSEVPAEHAVVVAGAGLFLLPDEAVTRTAQASTTTPFEDTLRFVGSEQVWTPRVVLLAARLRSRESRPYTVCVAAMGPIALKDVRDRTFAAFDAVMSTIPEESVRILQRLPDWTRRLSDDEDVRNVSDEIRELTASEDVHDQVLVQALAASGRFHEAWAVVESRPASWREGSIAQMLSIAGVATNAGQAAAARDLLERLAPMLPSDPAPLLNALDLATKLEQEVVGRALLQRLEKLVPGHPRVRRLSVLQAIDDGNWEHARELLHTPHLIDFQPAVSDAILARVKWELGQLSDAAFLDNARACGSHDDATVLVARRALDEERAHDAINLLSSARSGPRVTRLWCSIFERACRQELPAEVLGLALTHMLVGLGEQSTDRGLRSRVSEAFSTGQQGLVACTLMVSQLAAASPDLEGLQWPSAPRAASPEDTLAFFTDFFDQRAGQVVLSTLPQAIPIGSVPENPDALYWGIYEFLQIHLVSHFSADDQVPLMLVKAGVDLAYSMDIAPIERAYLAVDLLALAAKGMAMQGEFQVARNLAEAVIQLANTAGFPVIRRLAWTAYADVYLRCHNRSEGLMGIACALATSATPERGRDAIGELQVWIRCLRDFGQLEHALAAAMRHLELSRGQSELETRARHLCLTIRARLLGSQPETLRDLTAESATFLRDVVADAREDILPAVMLHVQLSRFCRQQAIELPAGSEELVAAALRRLAPESAARVRALADDAPEVDALFERLIRLYRSTAYVEDLASDRSELALLAGRVLESGAGADPLVALRTIEVLVDVSFRTSHLIDAVSNRVAHGYRALIVQGRVLSRVTLEKSAGPVAPTQTPALAADGESIVTVLERLSSAKIEFHAFALNDSREIVHVGKLPQDRLRLMDSRPCFRAARLAEWSSDQPKWYSSSRNTIPVTDEEVRKELRGIEITARAMNDSDATMFVTSVDLAAVPLNLLLRDGDFAGAAGPVVSTPSLAWLAGQPDAPVARGPRKLWIFPGRRLIGGTGEALGILGGRLPASVAARSIEVHLDARMENVERCELAVVAAHGLLGLTDKYFAGLADGFDQRYETAQLVDALAGSSVVVLLVCSGGRMELAPHGWATFGLPRLLLDAGVRAVVAAPWLLDVRVAYAWLDPFLRSCEEGQSIARATHTANLAIRSELPAPSQWLAMHTFGDPRITLSATT